MLERAINHLAAMPCRWAIVSSFIAATILMVGAYERMPLP